MRKSVLSLFVVIIIFLELMASRFAWKTDDPAMAIFAVGLPMSIASLLFAYVIQETRERKD